MSWPDAEPKAKGGERKGELGKFVRRAVLASLVGLGASEGLSLGARPTSIRGWYDETVAQAKRDYNGDWEGPRPSFAEYLEGRRIPSREYIEALETLMEEYDDPVYVFRGTTLLRSLLEVIPEFRTNASYGFTVRGHSVYLHEAGRETANDRELFTYEDMWDIVAELSHVEQAERDGRSGMALRAFLDTLAYPFLEGAEHRGRGVLYATEGRFEHEAHSRLEPRILVGLIAGMQRERYQQEKGRLGELLEEGGYPHTAEAFTFEAYERLLLAAETGRNGRTPLMIPPDLMFLLEETPGYEAHVYYGVIDFVPNQEHYGNLLALLRDCEARQGAENEKNG